MENHIFSEIKDSFYKSEIERYIQELENIPNSFCALFWLYSHDFIFISPSVERVLGHKYDSFLKQGLVFFQTIIPPRLLIPIYESMNSQAEQFRQSPNYILDPACFKVSAAVFNHERQEIPVEYHSVILDAKQYEPVSYLLLCIWFDSTGMKQVEIKRLSKKVQYLLLKIKEVYIKANPEKFKLLSLPNKITRREKEVAELLSQGYSSKATSEKLKITFNTVETYRKNLLLKFNAKNTAELVYKYGRLPVL
ncbi:response regulator transcription factor [Marivirga sp.]|uniref:response regulator transcription factor n=1 Tax=Marivirga sp. TaxID=2018662 RepID=UPI0025CE389C|nr:helix-turn-helix transcriptional regulator [Marivirga sp.]